MSHGLNEWFFSFQLTESEFYLSYIKLIFSNDLKVPFKTIYNLQFHLLASFMSKHSPNIKHEP